jgi:hypothetical protein
MRLGLLAGFGSFKEVYDFRTVATNAIWAPEGVRVPPRSSSFRSCWFTRRMTARSSACSSRQTV